MAKADWISAMPLFQRALRSQAELTILENSRLWQNDRTVSRTKFLLVLEKSGLRHPFVTQGDQFL